jgi:hypothetical protein
MLMRSLQQCRACRLTWFPQARAAAACPACGGTKVGGTLELFHAGVALILLGAAGWFMHHGPLIERIAARAPAILQAKTLTASATKPMTASSERVAAPAVKERRSAQVYVSSRKIKPSKPKVKRRQKAKTRSKHVQRRDQP